MRIISKFRDFYDSAAGLGIDNTVHYVRMPATAPNPDKNKDSTIYNEINTLPRYYVPYSSREVSFHGMVLLFCGKAYPMVKVEIQDWGCNSRAGRTPGKYYFYDAKTLTEFAKKECIRLDKSYFWMQRRSLDTEHGIKEFFALKLQPLMELHHTHKCPVILIKFTNEYRGDPIIELNPVLKDLKFMTQNTPFGTFQDIFSFITGVIGVNQTPMIEVSDKVLAAKRGHDGPYSFKNVPGKKRGRK